MAYTGLTITDEVHDTSKSSHAIPAYPEFTSKTVFDDAFYTERREECDRLMGAAIDYHEEVEGPGTPGNPGSAVDISDAVVSGPATVVIGANYVYRLSGANEDQYSDDYTIQWSVPQGEASIWGYESDTSDIAVVQVAGYQAGNGTVTVTLTERGNPFNTTTVTQAITIS